MRYLQHYIEHTRICTQIKCSNVVDSEGNDHNPITAYKEAYYQKNPIDTSREGLLARISGITKKEATTVIALLDYAEYLAHYTPPTADKAQISDNFAKFKNSSTPRLLASDNSELTRLIYYTDLKVFSRNRSLLA